MRLLALAFRMAVQAHFKKLGWLPQSDGASDQDVSASMNVAVIAAQQGLSPRDLATVARACVDDLLGSALVSMKEQGCLLGDP